MPTIYRNPVPGQLLPRPLSCSGGRCIEARKHAGSGFLCPNHEQGKGETPNPGGCQTRAFLYPRGASHGDFHFHQGIDIGTKAGLDIIAVMGGVVEHATHEWTPGFGGYGKVVVIKGDDNRYYLYAHCQDVLVEKGKRVVEATVIARTGSTFYSNANHQEMMGEARPHLHFEISRKPYPKAKIERTPEGANPDVREDPLIALAELGPWGTGKKFFLPMGQVATAARIEQLQRAVETQPVGGYFPVGANNFWHGGVHLSMPAGSVIKAPFAGRIVAARLDEDPMFADRDFGGTNFILMRHELPAAIVERFKVGDSKPAATGASEGADSAAARASKSASAAANQPSPEARRSVGAGPKATNAPDDVKEVARMLRSIPRVSQPAAGEGAHAAVRPYYENSSDPVSGQEPDFVDAILAFQAMIIRENGYSWHPDGVVKLGGVTWTKLKEQAEPAAAQDNATAGDAARTDDGASNPAGAGAAQPSDSDAASSAGQEPKGTPVWMLFMHVEATPLDEKQARKVPWLARVKTARSEPQAPSEAAQSAAQQEYDEKKKAFDAREASDGKEAHEYTLRASVGIKTTGGRQIPQENKGSDVLWVKRRLARFAYYHGALDETVGSDFVSALSAFQATHLRDCHGQGAGYMLPNKQTLKMLVQTRGQLGLDAPPTPPGHGAQAELSVDEQFTARFRERGPWEMTNVVADLDIGVEAGEPLWTAGYGSAHQGGPRTPLVHWEIFSEEALFGSWPTVEDANEDLTMDACDKLLAAVDEGEGVGQGDGVLTANEVARFYASDAALSIRQLQCKFRGEWAVEAAAVSSAIAKLNVTLVGEVEDVFGPYLLWKDAAKVLPASPHVWHYNPLSFLKEYARACGATTGELCVEAFIAHARAPDVEIVLLRDAAPVRPTQLTAQNGQVAFQELLPGFYTVQAHTSDGLLDARDVTISEGETTQLCLGQPPSAQAVDPQNPFKDYEPMRLTRCREGLGDVTLRPHYPRRGKSGVTIGYGYDLGARTREQVRGHLQEIKLADEHIESLMPAVGMNRDEGAEQWFDSHRAELRWAMTDDQRFQLLSLIYPKYQEAALKRATTYQPAISKATYNGLHFFVQELLTDLVFVGAHYSSRNHTGAQVNTILADTTTDDRGKLRALRGFVSNMPDELQPLAGRSWRIQYIDAALAELESEP